MARKEKSVDLVGNTTRTRIVGPCYRECKFNHHTQDLIVELPYHGCNKTKFGGLAVIGWSNDASSFDKAEVRYIAQGDELSIIDNVVKVLVPPSNITLVVCEKRHIATKTITSDSCDIEVGNVKLHFPSDSVEISTDIRVEVVGEYANPETNMQVSPTIHLYPHGQKFNKPVKITIPHYLKIVDKDDDGVHVIAFHGAGNEVAIANITDEPKKSSKENNDVGYASFEIFHFSPWCLLCPWIKTFSMVKKTKNGKIKKYFQKINKFDFENLKRSVRNVFKIEVAEFASLPDEEVFIVDQDTFEGYIEQAVSTVGVILNRELKELKLHAKDEQENVITTCIIDLQTGRKNYLFCIGHKEKRSFDITVRGRLLDKSTDLHAGQTIVQPNHIAVADNTPQNDYFEVPLEFEDKFKATFSDGITKLKVVIQPEVVTLHENCNQTLLYSRPSEESTCTDLSLEPVEELSSTKTFAWTINLDPQPKHDEIRNWIEELVKVIRGMDTKLDNIALNTLANKIGLQRVIEKLNQNFCKAKTPWLYVALPREKKGLFTNKTYDLHLLCNGTNRQKPHFLLDNNGRS